MKAMDIQKYSELVRGKTFECMDFLKGGTLTRIKEVNKREIIEGVSDDYVKRRLNTLMEYSKRNSQFYKAFWEAQDIKELPVMDPKQYQNFFRDIMCDNYKKGKKGKQAFPLKIVGTVGVPLTIYCDRDKLHRVKMNYKTVLELAGHTQGKRLAETVIIGKDDQRYSSLEKFENNSLYLDGEHLGEEYLKKVCEILEKKKVRTLVAYASFLNFFLPFIEKRMGESKSWNLERILVLGEGLSDSVYQMTKDLLGFYPMKSYGDMDRGFMALQLKPHGDYVVDLYNYHVEILSLDSNESVEEGKLGRIVITDYYNRAFPTLRYDTGDTGIMRTYYDEAGRKHALLTALYAKRGAVLYDTKSNPISVAAFSNILNNFEGRILQAKCIQLEKTKYEVLVVAQEDEVNRWEIVSAYEKLLGLDAQIGVTYNREIQDVLYDKSMICENLCMDYR